MTSAEDKVVVTLPCTERQVDAILHGLTHIAYRDAVPVLDWIHRLIREQNPEPLKESTRGTHI
jgi:hypothetical protein